MGLCCSSAAVKFSWGAVGLVASLELCSILSSEGTFCEGRAVNGQDYPTTRDRVVTDRDGSTYCGVLTRREGRRSISPLAGHLLSSMASKDCQQVSQCLSEVLGHRGRHLGRDEELFQLEISYAQLLSLSQVHRMIDFS